MKPIAIVLLLFVQTILVLNSRMAGIGIIAGSILVWLIGKYTRRHVVSGWVESRRTNSRELVVVVLQSIADPASWFAK